MDIAKSEIIIFNEGGLSLEVNVAPDEDTVWLNREQLSKLFQTDRTAIGRHIRNIYKNEELDYAGTCAKIAHVPGSRERFYETEYFNLDMILAIGYKVNARRGIIFRKWSSEILKQYLLKGYAVNHERLNQLSIAVGVMKRASDQLDSEQVLDVIEAYSIALNLLDEYDHETLVTPEGTEAVYRLEYEECRKLIDNMSFTSESALFGNEKDDSFMASIAAVYQTYGGVEVYLTLEEKAANLLYFVVKNHSFSDGNKRIAAVIFLYFLDKNNALYRHAKKIINDHTLVALVIMIAESRPQEKETMIKLVMNFLNPVN